MKKKTYFIDISIFFVFFHVYINLEIKIIFDLFPLITFYTNFDFVLICWSYFLFVHNFTWTHVCYQILNVELYARLMITHKINSKFKSVFWNFFCKRKNSIAYKSIFWYLLIIFEYFSYFMKICFYVIFGGSSFDFMNLNIRISVIILFEIYDEIYGLNIIDIRDCKFDIYLL